MLHPNLDAIFRPKSIAIVGASPDTTKIGGRLLASLQTYKFPGRLYGINSRYDAIGDVPCVASPEDLPEPVDLVILAIPATAVVAAAKACAQAGVRALIVVSSGFRESGPQGEAREAELLEIVKAHNMAMIGPNADGIVNVGRGLAAVFATAMDEPGLRSGRTSLVTQSGAVGSFAISLARRTGVGLDNWVSTGNAALLEVHDFARYLLDDDDTQALGLYVEGIRDGAGFLEVSESFLDAGKPIVLLKGGMTNAGQKAASTHTASLAGAARVWEGVSYSRGIVLTPSFQSFFDTVAAFGALDGRVGKRVALLTSSGAAGVLATDAAERSGLGWVDFGSVREKLAEQLPLSAIESPLDLPGILGAPGRTKQVLDIVAADEGVDAIVLLTGARENQGPRLAEEISAARAASGKPIFVSWTACPAETRMAFWKAGIPCYEDASATVEVVARLVWYWEERDRILAARGETGHRQKKRDASPVKARAGMVSERESKAVIAGYGIPVPGGALARNAQEAGKLADEIGYPIAMKIESPQITHKTEVGGVVLHLGDRNEVTAAFSALMQRVGEKMPEAALAGAYLERMAGPGVELLLGVSRDPQFGPCLMVGLGGIWAEAMQDVAIRPLPVNRGEVDSMLKSLKGRGLLEGARGKIVDRDAVIDAVLDLARLAEDLGDDVEAIDINPLVAGADGVLAIDCRIEMR